MGAENKRQDGKIFIPERTGWAESLKNPPSEAWMDG